MRRPTSSLITRCRRFAGRLGRDRRGATAIEYGMIVAVIVIVLMVSFVELAGVTKGMWNNVSDKVQNAK